MTRYLMTHSLMSSWLYAMKESPNEDMTTKRDPLAEFMITLRRKEIPPTAAMINGTTFENLVTAIVNKAQMFDYSEMNEKTGEIRSYRIKPDDHKWYDAASKVARIVGGGVLQYRASKTIEVGGLTA